VRLHDRRLTQVRIAAALVVAAGVLLAAFGVIAPGMSPDRDPVPLPISASVAVPPAGPFGGKVILYGSALSPGTDLDLIGAECTVDGTDRATDTRGTTTDGTEELDRLVIGGEAMLPLLVMTRTGDDAQVSCTGPLAAAAQPLYLVSTYGVRDLVPMAAYSLAVLAIAVGAACLWLLRPEPFGS
jgi:hypothetical protein